MDVSIDTLNQLTVASVRHVGPYPECGKAWEALSAWAGPKNLFNESTAFFGICHDDPNQVPEDQLRYDACMTVPEDMKGEGEVTILTIPGGDYATLLYQGPYDNLGEQWMALFEKGLPQLSKEFDFTRPCFEQYLNDPGHTKPEDLLTKLHVPAK
ncbi:AraC family transcriptional regulator [Salidesulfovibrio brasiliensis]|uniref:AraC family transcriptional regulator n=1 Tax=Salidesulfovibrio brasiliensis TaxID=221711 RepID=UPI0006CFEFA2|nr:GyrI-like domain-containing protein [Salidesulfovibrio brasiliensis]